METASEIMTPNPVVATLDMPSETCLMRMLDRGFRHMPVVDAEGCLLGLLTDHALHITQSDVAAGAALVPVEGCPEEATVRQVLSMFGDSHDAVVIVNEHNHPVGLITEHDVARLAPALLEGSEEKVVRPQRDLVVVGPDTSRREAFESMLEHQIRHLPVVGNGPVLGVVSMRDLLSAGVTQQQDGPVQQLLGDGFVHVVHEGAPLLEVAAIMAAHKVGCVPVLNERHLPVGVLSRSDLLESILASLGGVHDGSWSDG